MNMISLKWFFVKNNLGTYLWTMLRSAVAWFGTSLTLVLAINSYAHIKDQLPVKVVDTYNACPVVWLLILLVILFGISFFRHLPQLKAKYRDSSTGIKVIIEHCNLLKQDGMKIIHTVDTFETDEKIVYPESLHGKFLADCRSRGIDVDAMVDNALQYMKQYSIDNQLVGRKKRYAIGTVIKPLADDNANHYLKDFRMVAFSKITSQEDQSHSIELSVPEYKQLLVNMWNTLSEPTQRMDTINMAIFGNKFLKMSGDYTTEHKIAIILDSFFIACHKQKCCDTLRICVHESNARDLDFPTLSALIKHYATKPRNKKAKPS